MNKCRYIVGEIVKTKPTHRGTFTGRVVFVDQAPPPRPDGRPREPQYVVKNLRGGKTFPILDRELL